MAPRPFDYQTVASCIWRNFQINESVGNSTMS